MKYFACLLILVCSVATVCPGGECGCQQPAPVPVDVDTLTKDTTAALRAEAQRVLGEVNDAASIVGPTAAILPRATSYLKELGASDVDLDVFVKFQVECAVAIEGVREVFVKSAAYGQYGDAQPDTPLGRLRAAAAYLQAAEFCAPLLEKLTPLAEEAEVVQQRYHELKAALQEEDKAA